MPTTVTQLLTRPSMERIRTSKVAGPFRSVALLLVGHLLSRVTLGAVPTRVV